MASTDRGSDDPFEAVQFPEDMLNKRGYEDGYEHGFKEGLLEGFLSGQKHGERIGSEVGFYLGFAETWLSLMPEGTDGDERTIRALKAFLQRVREFQVLDITSPDHTTTLTQLRAKFKQILSLLKVSTKLYGMSRLERFSF